MKQRNIPTPQEVFQPWGEGPREGAEHKQWLLDHFLDEIEEFLSNRKTHEYLRTYHNQGKWPALYSRMSSYIPTGDLKLVMDEVTEIMKQYGWLFQAIDQQAGRYPQIVYQPYIVPEE